MTENLVSEKPTNIKHGKAIDRLTLMDNVFMRTCFQDNIPAAETVVRTVLDNPNIVVTSIETERNMQNLRGRSIWLDAYAKDNKDQKYDIEIQRDNKGTSPRRARYHASMLDLENDLTDHEIAKNLRDTYVIFITENDVLKGNAPVYPIERVILNQQKPFGDGSHIIYVNGKYSDESTPLGRLIHDFRCENPDDMYFATLRSKPYYYKHTEEGRQKMGDIMDNLIREANEKVIQETKEKDIMTLIRALKKHGVSDHDIKENLMTDYSLTPEEAEKYIAS